MPAGSQRFQIGNLSCTVLSDGYVANPASWLFPNAVEVDVARALEARGGDCSSVISPYTCLLIETGREIVLADAGMGRGSQTSGAILARLEMSGIRPEQVSTVIFTHAHPDHISGAVNTRDHITLRPAFPNARHVLAEAEWEFWNGARTDLRGMRIDEAAKSGICVTARRCLRALRFQVELIERETEIVPGVWALPAPGHTPGHLALLLSSQGQNLLHLGDAAVHPLHLEHPEWENGFDLEPERAMAARRRLLDRATAENMRLMAFHFPFPSVGRVETRTGGGWNWTPGW